MKNPFPYSLLALALAFGAGSLRAQDAQAPAAAPAASDSSAPAKPKTPLDKDMGKIGKAMHKLKHQISDATQNASSLGYVADARAAAEAAMNEKPEKTADIPAADQAKFISDYKAQMQKLVDTLDKLAAALKANDNAAAETLYKQLGGLEKQGHKEFRKPEDN